MISGLFWRLVVLAVFARAGWELGQYISESPLGGNPAVLMLGLAAFGGVLGFLLAPYLTIRPYRWVRRQIRLVPVVDLLVGTVGLVVGLVISALLALPLSILPGYLGKFLPFVAAVILGYLGIVTMVTRQRELLQLVENRRGILPPSNGRASDSTAGTLVDTSAIIDGRIADIGRTGFLPGPLIVPKFVLDELQYIADSPDVMRRNRGRHGLDILNRLQKETDVTIQIVETDYADLHDVDGKLVRMAKALGYAIVTTDFNLNRVAGLRGIRVLNVNELANAVKSVVMPGEEMAVKIIQEGKEIGQGVGFLDDGTMVVVEGGRRYLNSQLDIVVTRVLQTVAGRMIFAQPKAD